MRVLQSVFQQIPRNLMMAWNLPPKKIVLENLRFFVPPGICQNQPVTSFPDRKGPFFDILRIGNDTVEQEQAERTEE
jgi:hypothetical protein